MKRKIIKIDEEKCTGCGLCIPDCPEGALQLIDGKARLVSDLFCDGLGACIGNCPENAIHIEEREAEPYDEDKVMINVIKAGFNTVKAHLKHLMDHGEEKLFDQAVDFLKRNNFPVPKIEDPRNGAGCSCPSAIAQDLSDLTDSDETSQSVPLKSRLQNWPVQLQLINPRAPYFQDADLLIAADCVPFAFPNFHERFAKGKITIIFCPKLDNTTDSYIEKLANILMIHNIKSISIARMQVPCCGGTEMIIKQALEKAGKSEMVRVNVISIKGEIVH